MGYSAQLRTQVKVEAQVTLSQPQIERVAGSFQSALAARLAGSSFVRRLVVLEAARTAPTAPTAQHRLPP